MNRRSFTYIFSTIFGVFPLQPDTPNTKIFVYCTAHVLVLACIFDYIWRQSHQRHQLEVLVEYFNAFTTILAVEAHVIFGMLRNREFSQIIRPLTTDRPSMVFDVIAVGFRLILAISTFADAFKNDDGARFRYRNAISVLSISMYLITLQFNIFIQLAAIRIRNLRYFVATDPLKACDCLQSILDLSKKIMNFYALFVFLSAVKVASNMVLFGFTAVKSVYVLKKMNLTSATFFFLNILWLQLLSSSVHHFEVQVWTFYRRLLKVVLRKGSESYVNVSPHKFNLKINLQQFLFC